MYYPLNAKARDYHFQTEVVRSSIAQVYVFFFFRPSKVEKILTEGGATRKAYLTSAVNVCVAGPGADENELLECLDVHEVPTVTLAWVSQSVR